MKTTGIVRTFINFVVGHKFITFSDSCVDFHSALQFVLRIFMPWKHRDVTHYRILGEFPIDVDSDVSEDEASVLVKQYVDKADVLKLTGKAKYGGSEFFLHMLDVSV